MEFSKSRFRRRNAEAKFIAKQNKARLDPKNIRSDESGWPSEDRERLPARGSVLARGNDPEPSLTGVAETADPASDAIEFGLAEIEITERLDRADIAKAAQCSERGGALQRKHGHVGPYVKDVDLVACAVEQIRDILVASTHHLIGFAACPPNRQIRDRLATRADAERVADFAHAQRLKRASGERLDDTACAIAF